MANSNRILVKLSPTAGLAAAAPRANLRPLGGATPQKTAFGLATTPSWYIADLPDAAGPNPWDQAHARVANQLGIDESAVLFAEPDLAQSFNDGSQSPPEGAALAAAPNLCTPIAQDPSHNKAVGPEFAWHLRDDFSQLRAARNAVPFADPRTRVAHIDTGYDPKHGARPVHIPLEHSFVDGDPDLNKAQAREQMQLLPENLDHGTGTIGILAGRQIPPLNDYLGGAPHAEVVPLRIANSVALFFTSAFVQALQFAVDNHCDVATMSMGGLPSKAWSEAVDAAYRAGLCLCAAAGNNVQGIPSHHVIYPARYHQTIAVCGVMANGQPYYNIQPFALQGSWGPTSCMTAAIAAYTPNIPWPVFGCANNAIRENGEGTSSATPQVAAAVALWFEHYKAFLPRDWRRVEAVRYALFSSAAAKGVDQPHFGNGILRANDALSVRPNLQLPQTPADSDSFSFLRVLTGLGIADPPPRERMFNLELTQLYLTNADLQQIVPDPEAQVKGPELRTFIEAVVDNAQASVALRKHLADRYSVVAGTSIPHAPDEIVTPPKPACDDKVRIPDPPFRRLRTYAVDPSLSTRLATADVNDVVLKVRWEKLEKGPVGEYLKVEDTDATGFTYAPVDIDSPQLLAQDGCPPAEGNPAFHQQMVYAVAMHTIAHFERALGRPVNWRPRINPSNDDDDSQFVRRLTIRPHALRQANAYYSPQEIALQFGYFEAADDDPGDHVPGSTVYACLSHDIIAHETTHAILDGMHRRFNEASNPDVLALHEAFADIVALMQHFTIPEILENEITRTRGDLKAESILGSLAVQFGHATGGRGALRDAIGTFDKDGKWTRLQAEPTALKTALAPHARGAILVAAVFDAFLAIYETRTADLLRIYTNGTGVLRPGAIHPDLVRRLAAEAVKSATHVLNMCIRAVDYIPPVDITFGEYLRGIITADSDLVQDDRYNYRVAFVEAFRQRGIYPPGLQTLSVDTLRWQGIETGMRAQQYGPIIRQLKRYADRCLYLADREELFQETRRQRAELHGTLQKAMTADVAKAVGLDPTVGFEVHELRSSMRVGPDGQHRPQIIVGLAQSREIKVDGSHAPHTFRGGSTIVVDLPTATIQYAIYKRLDSAAREETTRALMSEAARDPLRALLMAPDRKEPFALLHSLADLA